MNWEPNSAWEGFRIPLHIEVAAPKLWSAYDILWWIRHFCLDYDGRNECVSSLCLLGTIWFIDLEGPGLELTIPKIKSTPYFGHLAKSCPTYILWRRWVKGKNYLFWRKFSSNCRPVISTNQISSQFYDYSSGERCFFMIKNRHWYLINSTLKPDSLPLDMATNQVFFRMKSVRRLSNTDHSYNVEKSACRYDSNE